MPAFTTTNGGLVWHRHDVLTGVQVPSAVEGGAACTTSGTCVADASGQNGGRTVAGPSAATLSTVSTVAGAIGSTGVVCTTGDTCYRVDALQGTMGYASQLLVSSNDGVVWSDVDLPPGDEPVEVGGCQGPATCEVIAVRGVTIHALEQGNYDYAAASVVDLTTADAGASWTASVLAGRNRIPQAASCSSSTQCSVALTEDNGSGYTELASTDNGATWTATPVPGSQADGGYFFAPTMDLSCGPGGSCLFWYASVFGGQPTFLRSADGGATWIVASLPANEVFGITCLASDTCLVVYANLPANSESSRVPTYLTESTDGGATWSRRTPVPNVRGDLSSATCVTALDCTATYTEAAMATTDGGTTWTALGWPKQPAAVLSSTTQLSCSVTTCLAVESALTLSLQGIDTSASLLRLSS